MASDVFPNSNQQKSAERPTEACNTADAIVDVLFDGLSSVERLAVAAVDRYLVSCAERSQKRVLFLSQNRQQDSLAKEWDTHENPKTPIPLSQPDILCWTTLYHRKNALETACRTALKSRAASFEKLEDNANGIDWFRVLCCVLDRERLKKAHKYWTEELNGNTDAPPRPPAISSDGSANSNHVADSVTKHPGDDAPENQGWVKKRRRTTANVTEPSEDQENLSGFCGTEPQTSSPSPPPPSDHRPLHGPARPSPFTPVHTSLRHFLKIWAVRSVQCFIDLRLPGGPLSGSDNEHRSGARSEELPFSPKTLSCAQLVNSLHRCEPLLQWVVWPEGDPSAPLALLKREWLCTAQDFRWALQQLTALAWYYVSGQDNAFTGKVSISLASDSVHTTSGSGTARSHSEISQTSWSNPGFVKNLFREGLRHETFETGPLMSWWDTWSQELLLQPASPIESKLLSADAKVYCVVMGVASILLDLLEEFWNRVSIASNTLNADGATTDALSRLRPLGNLLGLQHLRGPSPTALQIPVLLEEVEALIGSRVLPRDLRDATQNAMQVLQQAQETYTTIQKEKQAREQREAAEENARRETAAAEAAKREQKQRAAIQFIQNAVARQTQYHISNPFWVLGVTPHQASLPLLLKIKRKLSLLVHPDKCVDPALKTEAQIAFTATNEAVTAAINLLETGTHWSCLVNMVALEEPPSSRPPFADEVGIPEPAGPRFTPDFKAASYTMPELFSLLAPLASVGRSPHMPSGPPPGFQTKPSESKTSSERPQPPSVWKCGEFEDYFSNVQFVPVYPPSLTVPPPKLLTKPQTHSQIWASVPEGGEPGRYTIRLFLSRPWQQPTTSHVDAESHEAEDGISFLVPGALCRALRSVALTQAAANNRAHRLQSAAALKHFSAIVLLHSSTVNLSEWTLGRKDVVQPVAEDSRRRSAIYLAVQTVDTVTRTASKIVWTGVAPRRFVLPQTKSKIISTIQLFENAPPQYEVHQVIQRALKSDIPLTEFPSVQIMMGWTNATLSAILCSLVEAAKQS